MSTFARGEIMEALFRFRAAGCVRQVEPGKRASSSLLEHPLHSDPIKAGTEGFARIVSLR
jgi:hypothetical protein